MKKVFEYVDLVARFHSFVILQMTGAPDVFAAKLGVSRSTLYNLIAEIKSYGIDVEYVRSLETFRYVHPDKVEIVIRIRQKD